MLVCCGVIQFLYLLINGIRIGRASSARSSCLGGHDQQERRLLARPAIQSLLYARRSPRSQDGLRPLQPDRTPAHTQTRRQFLQNCLLLSFATIPLAYWTRRFYTFSSFRSSGIPFVKKYSDHKHSGSRTSRGAGRLSLTGPRQPIKPLCGSGSSAHASSAPSSPTGTTDQTRTTIFSPK